MSPYKTFPLYFGWLFKKSIDFSKQYFETSTTESAIYEQGILPVKEAPVYPYKPFIKSLREFCLSFNKCFIDYFYNVLNFS